jgi:hypothetical protein
VLKFELTAENKITITGSLSVWSSSCIIS